MSDIPHWSVVPPLRCSELRKGHTRVFCGELARWKRVGGPLFADAYFCDRHRLETDVELAGVAKFRRVTVQAVVYLAGVAPGRGEAEREAIDRLDAAIAAAGGVLHVLGTASALGEGAALAAAPAAPVKRGIVG